MFVSLFHNRTEQLGGNILIVIFTAIRFLILLLWDGGLSLETHRTTNRHSLKHFKPWSCCSLLITSLQILICSARLHRANVVYTLHFLSFPPGSRCVCLTNNLARNSL